MDSEKDSFPTVEEFFENSVPCNAVAKLYDRLEAEEPLIDPQAIRRRQDWSDLGYRVVGE